MASTRFIASATILAVAAAMAIGGALLAPDACSRVDLAARFATPDFSHWLGRDELGRDTACRLLAGATWTIGQTLAATAFAGLAGLLLHRLMRKLERIIVVLARVLFVAPKFLLTASPAGHLVLAALGAASMLPGYLGVIAFIAWFGPGPARSIISFGLMFSVAVAYLQVTARPTPARLALLLFGWIILPLSALDAIGLGLQPPRPGWGVMVGGLHGAISLPATLAGGCVLLVAAAAIVAAHPSDPAT